MKCTSCSAEVKPVVALDIDGTLAKYHEALVDFIINYTGYQPGPEVPWPGHTCDRIGGEFGDWVCFAWQLERRVYRDIKLAFRQGGQKRFMPVYPNAADVASAALAEGAEVWVTTARPYQRHDSVDPDTREWLRRNQIAWDYMVYGEDKYDQLSQLVDFNRVVAVLDDLPEMYDQALNVFGGDVPILRRNAWNEGTEVGRQSVEDLLDARALVVRAVQNWNRKNY